MNLLTRKGVRRVLGVVLVLFLILTWGGAYVPPPLPFSCANFSESYWEEFRFNIDSTDDVASTVHSLWGIEKNRLRPFWDETDPYGISWISLKLTGPTGMYTAWFWNGVLRKVDFERSFPLPRPSLSQVVECLGAPKYYIAFYGMAPEAVKVNLDLLYPDRGFVVRYVSPFTSLFMSKPPARFHPHMRIRELAVVAPGAPAQMVPSVYSIGHVGGGYSHSACLSKPWPGSIEAMEIVPLTELSRCGNRGEEK
ncbi:hypothetical protein F4Y93_14625 [Candidatus Poribacteria bacterium]|nr:hypothetical protein [Candidatus Poribacteria bacterium]